MQVIRGILNFKPHHRGAVVTMGNFDGVHRGHQAVLGRVRQKADELGVPSMLICFEPQPKEFFDHFNAPARLTRFREKVELLEAHGVDFVLCFKFNEAFRTTPAERTVELITDTIAPSALFVGDDFRFGHERRGDFNMLQAAGEKAGFPVRNLHTLSEDEVRVSSSRIRELLAAGSFDEAETLLGHPYSIMGHVVYGRQLGRTLGAPTANVQIKRYRAPIDGVYAVEIEGLSRPLQGVANLGLRPTLNEITPRPILEVHIFGFDDDIYGRCVKTVFRHKIREEIKFAGLEELKTAIVQDVKDAKNYFAA